MTKAFDNFYSGKKVFVSGHTGFKGSWLSIWLKMLGAEVIGYALEAEKESMFRFLRLSDEIFVSNIGDIRNMSALRSCLAQYRPEIIFHLAAQPLVRESYIDPVLTYETNVIGTLNLLETARAVGSVKIFVNVTSDKCYENLEKDYCYKESDPMGGYDMYSSSKACSEILTASYRRSFLSDGGFALASARAGNVIGGGDWSKDRLVPDIIKSINAGNKIVLRNPAAVRPWQHVLEPLSGYLVLAEKLSKNPTQHSCGYNFGPEPNLVYKVIDITNKIVSAFNEKTDVIFEEQEIMHESKLLQLNIEKAKKELGIFPILDIDDTIDYTVNWYCKFFGRKTDMLDFTKTQIMDFMKKARHQNTSWT
ncbi:MAG: CDP-glucose 4,6-dehydratase [Holosporaceae bacterium]|nr:CDP-glucose 4,6-dehydratase [Holosporaceae bacterium]